MTTPAPIDELMAEAVRRSPGVERDAWIATACGGDSSLERELRKLLELHESAGSFMASPMVETPGTIVPEEPLPPTLGPFKVEEELGRGGMGVVVRAKDTRLNRTVALKTLPGPEKVSEGRLQREAEALAALSHPNVATIFGIEEHEGRRLLVLEYVEGETLAERLRAGKLPLGEALDVCAQIADGVAASHDAGVIHRDLKPSNIMITAGRVKVLDFGIAKFAENADAERSSPDPVPVTATGNIFGSADYMSPEQARGQRVDERTDVWSFGVILFECLTGASPFRAASLADSIAAILDREIRFDDLPPTTRPLLKRCLERDVNRRFRNMHDVGLTLADCTSLDAVAPAMETGGRRSMRSRVALVLAVAAVIVSAVAGVLVGRQSMDPSPGAGRSAMHLTVPLASVPDPFSARAAIVHAISPDGRTIAYVGSAPGEPDAIHVRSLHGRTEQRLAGTEGARAPQFSPDGRQILFRWSDADDTRTELRRVDVGGGPVLTVFSVSETGDEPFDEPSSTAVWGSNDELVALSLDGSCVYRVPLASGEVQLAARAVLDESDAGGPFRPSLVPGGRHLLVSQYDGRRETNGHLVAIDLETASRHVVIEDALAGMVLPTGHLVFVRDRKLCAAAIDLDTLQVTGAVVPMISNMGGYQVASNGHLVFHSRPQPRPRRLIAIDRDGVEQQVTSFTGLFMGDVRASPDGNWIAVTRKGEDGRYRAILVDTTRGTSHPLGDGPETSYGAGWLSSGEPFCSWHPSGEAGRIAIFDPRTFRIDRFIGGDDDDDWSFIDGAAFTPDGRYAVAKVRVAGGDADLHVIDVESPGQPVPIALDPTGINNQPALSPDGRWLAWTVGLGTTSEVFVRAFDPERPKEGVARSIAGRGSARPFWSRDGTELFYLDLAAGHVMGVRVEADPALSISSPERILDRGSLDLNLAWAMGDRRVDVLPDGRFVYVANSKRTDPTQLHIVLDWTEELRTKVSAR